MSHHSQALALLGVAIYALMPSADAQQLRNVANFDATLLAGKTCKGTFDASSSGQFSKGANLSIEGTAYGLPRPAAPHVERDGSECIYTPAWSRR